MERVAIPPNIAAAIRRSQDARAALRARRRRMAAVAVVLCAAAAAPVSLSLADFGSGGMVEAAVAKAQSLVDLLEQRSPGQRTEAQLTKTKRKHVALAKTRPPVRKPVAPTIASPLTPMEVQLASIVLPPPELIPAPVGQVAIAPPPTLGASVSPPGGGGSIVTPPGGGGGPPATIPTPQPHEPVIVTPPVPEPATWAMMLLGFGLIGWQIRRGTAPRRQAQTA
jgi:hypothetical protein